MPSDEQHFTGIHGKAHLGQRRVAAGIGFADIIKAQNRHGDDVLGGVAKV
jgi:hypothetical protein